MQFHTSSEVDISRWKMLCSAFSLSQGPFHRLWKFSLPVSSFLLGNSKKVYATPMNPGFHHQTCQMVPIASQDSSKVLPILVPQEKDELEPATDNVTVSGVTPYLVAEKREYFSVFQVNRTSLVNYKLRFQSSMIDCTVFGPCYTRSVDKGRHSITIQLDGITSHFQGSSSLQRVAEEQVGPNH
ncbi:Hypothetical predicted protein [Pelobates cultripes]|uniref:Uncharacterized protein n=1 Tax=Pelobates cultripes TaxID=61616 RepID=A0AAD1VHW4_PELCU|nr:Hypothetical predicted protein [Pelobates cultripes]